VAPARLEGSGQRPRSPSTPPGPRRWSGRSTPR